MTWRDLDLHLVRPINDVAAFFAVGGERAALLTPHRMHFRDESRGRSQGLPVGFYWGIYLGNERAGAWKIDLWQTGREGFEVARQFTERIASQLTEEHRTAIRGIKSECWQHPGYRREFSAADIYSAVLDRGVRSLDDFWTDLKLRDRRSPSNG